MKIIYSPYYSHGTYIASKPGDVHLGEVIVGTRGLLDELELRSGHKRKESTPFERTVAYYNAIKLVLDSGATPFYKESFEKDELGVSGELLRWRDALVMSGWTIQVTSDDAVSYKFRDLAQIEGHFNFPGEADRWQSLKSVSGELKGCTVEVKVPKSSLEKVISDVLDASGAKVEYVPEMKGEELKLASKIKVLEFRNRVDAYRWAAGQSFDEGTLLINHDNKAFNDVLRAMGRPLVKAEYSESNPLTLQIFKLGFGLFSEIVDIKTLVSYLNIPINPLNAEARKALLCQLCDNGGYGSQWQNLLSEHDVCSHALVVAPNPPAEAPVQAVRSYSDELKSWAMQYCVTLAAEGKDSDLMSQLHTLYDMCDALDKLLDTAVSAIDYDTLRRWVDGIYSACSFPAEKAQLGSTDIISDVNGIVSGPDKLVWLDCNATGHAKYPLFFLSTAEIDFLKSKGVYVVSEETFSRTVNLAAKKALSLVKDEIILITSRKAYGSRVDENPIFTEIKAKKISFENIEEPSMPAGIELKVSKPSEPECEFSLEKGIDIPERKHGESYSSLDTLIQRPVDYVLDYILNLREQDLTQVDDVRTTKGNVAHAVIQQLVEISKKENRTDFTDAEIDDVVSNQSMECGVLLVNSKVEYDSFCLKLKESVKTLFAEINSRGLKPFDSEHYVEVDLPKAGKDGTIGKFNARIDLLLQDEDENFVIIDLKWSESHRYKDKVAGQQDLQLVLYKHALETAYPEKKVLGCGYYVIPQYKVFTSDEYFSDWSCAEVVELEEVYDVYGEAVRSYNFRKKQLKEGILEGSEGQGLNQLNQQYIAAMDVDKIDLYPLEGDWQDPDLKAVAYGDKNYILKGRAI